MGMAVPHHDQDAYVTQIINSYRQSLLQSANYRQELSSEPPSLCPISKPSVRPTTTNTAATEATAEAEAADAVETEPAGGALTSPSNECRPLASSPGTARSYATESWTPPATDLLPATQSAPQPEARQTGQPEEAHAAPRLVPLPLPLPGEAEAKRRRAEEAAALQRLITLPCSVLEPLAKLAQVPGLGAEQTRAIAQAVFATELSVHEAYTVQSGALSQLLAAGDGGERDAALGARSGAHRSERFPGTAASAATAAATAETANSSRVVACDERRVEDIHLELARHGAPHVTGHKGQDSVLAWLQLHDQEVGRLRRRLAVHKRLQESVSRIRALADQQCMDSTHYVGQNRVASRTKTFVSRMERSLHAGAQAQADAQADAQAQAQAQADADPVRATGKYAVQSTASSAGVAQLQGSRKGVTVDANNGMHLPVAVRALKTTCWGPVPPTPTDADAADAADAVDAVGREDEGCLQLQERGSGCTHASPSKKAKLALATDAQCSGGRAEGAGNTARATTHATTGADTSLCSSDGGAVLPEMPASTGKTKRSQRSSARAIRTSVTVQTSRTSLCNSWRLQSHAHAKKPSKTRR